MRITLNIAVNLRTTSRLLHSLYPSVENMGGSICNFSRDQLKNYTIENGLLYYNSVNGTHLLIVKTRFGNRAKSIPTSRSKLTTLLHNKKHCSALSRGIFTPPAADTDTNTVASGDRTPPCSCAHGRLARVHALQRHDRQHRERCQGRRRRDQGVLEDRRQPGQEGQEQQPLAVSRRTRLSYHQY